MNTTNQSTTNQSNSTKQVRNKKEISISDIELRIKNEFQELLIAYLLKLKNKGITKDTHFENNLNNLLQITKQFLGLCDLFQLL